MLAFPPAKPKPLTFGGPGSGNYGHSGIIGQRGGSGPGGGVPDLPDTKVVNSKGEPLLVYHGTASELQGGKFAISAPAAPLKWEGDEKVQFAKYTIGVDMVFHDSNAGSYTAVQNGSLHPGFNSMDEAKSYIQSAQPDIKFTGRDAIFFAANPIYAEKYAKDYEDRPGGGTPRIISAYLDLKNPMDPAKPESWDAVKPTVENWLKQEEGRVVPEQLDRMQSMFKGGYWGMVEAIPGMVDAIKAAGYDGYINKEGGEIKYHGQSEQNYMRKGGADRSTTYAVFNPAAIHVREEIPRETQRFEKLAYYKPGVKASQTKSFAATGQQQPFSAYIWNPYARAYVSATGEEVDTEDLRTLVGELISDSTENLRALAEAVQNGEETNLSQFNISMKEELKNLYIAEHVLVKGGIDQMQQSDWGSLGSSLKDQYYYVDKLTRDLENGDIGVKDENGEVIVRDSGIPELDDSFLDRVSLYTESPWGAAGEFENVLKDRENDLGSMERLVLGDSKQSCAECLADSELGWQPAGTLKDIGDRECDIGCNCSFAFENQALDEAAQSFEFSEAFAFGGPGSGWFASAGHVPETGLVYHGTSSEFIKSIQEHGLLASKLGQGQMWNPEKSDQGHVFFSNQRPTAEYWGDMATGNHGGKVMLLTIEIPKSEADKISADPDATKVRGATVAWRFNGDIPPEWIVKIEEGKGW